MKAAFLAFLLVAAPAQAEVIEVLELLRGEVVLFHDTPGPCVRGALFAEYRETPFAEPIPGCYVIKRDWVWIVFLDTDTLHAPKVALRKPTKI